MKGKMWVPTLTSLCSQVSKLSISSLVHIFYCPPK